MLRIAFFCCTILFSAIVAAAPVGENISSFARNMGYPVKVDVSVEIYTEAQANSFVEAARKEGLSASLWDRSMSIRPMDKTAQLTPHSVIREDGAVVSNKWLFKLKQVHVQDEQHSRDLQQKLTAFVEQGYSVSHTISK
ncbi:hypothetical protein [Undibacterium terreum]|uniref:Uncharacterized protein n=1 Tax=Undibacterium terreum TaxID=1224302 RepID=A0A916UDL6_9BURK|nr:hypothetical protein [Undibacterium terreum]GGC67169.1 hypothetical protein GCM10011396_12700 [Undibacterium terreum]